MVISNLIIIYKQKEKYNKNIMSLPNYLAKIKSSGIYRFVWDKSEIAGVDAEVLRLVVGYSEKGPFNTPVYVTSESDFKSIYGGISKKLEKRGIYFHRLALQCLAKGPIICLNLKKFANEHVSASSFNVVDENEVLQIPVESIYDTARFWKLDPESISEAVTKAKATIKNKYISISAADSKDASCSIFMRGYKPNGYDVTIKNWFASQSEEVPEYFVHEGKDYSSLLVSDFFAEIYMFKGEFTSALCASAPLNKYFDIVEGKPQLKEYIENAFGEKSDTLALLANETASNFVNAYSGILLPFFKSNTGSYISLDLLFNADNNAHKMMMNLNSDLIYDGTISPMDLVTTAWTADATKAVFGNILKRTVQEFSGTSVKAAELGGTVAGYTGDYKYNTVEGKEATVFNPDFIVYKPAADDKIRKYAGGYEYDYAGIEKITLPIGDVDAKKYTAAKDSEVVLNAKDIYEVEGVLYYKDGSEVKLVNMPFVDLETIEIDLESKKVYAHYEYTKDGKRTYHIVGTETLTDVADVYTDGIKVYDEKTNAVIKTVPTAGEAKDATYTTISGATVNGFDFVSVGFEVGDRILKDGTMYSITTVDADFMEASTFDGSQIVVNRTEEVTKCNHSCTITDYNLKPVYYKGYEYEYAAPKPEEGRDLGRLNWQKFILSALVDYDGLRTGLTSRNDLDYRYIVDTFEAFVDSEVHKELAMICKQKDNALGFLNFPAIKTFKNCEYSSFTDENNRFQTKYIKEGANKQKNPGRLFSLVSETNGASFVSYNTPLTFTDGTVKTYVPSAALVSNNFMEKYESRQPYYIVAGPNYGRMIADGLVGPDFNFTRADLDILEPMGVNAMVYVPRKGTMINSNQTAKQNPVTALSKINIRELVIYLQDEIEKLLQDYQWEFNTQQLRDLVKQKADTICERVKQNGGLSEYLNVCDSSNNTEDVLNNEMFVLSTSIEPGFGAGKMIQELTIYKKGGMSSLIK